MEGVAVLAESARAPLEHREKSLSKAPIPQMHSKGPANLATHSAVGPALAHMQLG